MVSVFVFFKIFQVPSTASFDQMPSTAGFDQSTTAMRKGDQNEKVRRLYGTFECIYLE